MTDSFSKGFEGGWSLHTLCEESIGREMMMQSGEPGGLSSVLSRSHWLKTRVSTPNRTSRLIDYREERNDPKSASDAEETEGALADTWNPTPHHLSDVPPLSAASMLYFGTLFYVSVLLVNALAVLNEERFLARSSYLHVLRRYPVT